MYQTNEYRYSQIVVIQAYLLAIALVDAHHDDVIALYEAPTERLIVSKTQIILDFLSFILII